MTQFLESQFYSKGPAKGAIIFYREGGRLFVGGPEFFWLVLRGDQFFSMTQRGWGPEYFRLPRGGGQNFLQEGGPDYFASLVQFFIISL